MVIRKAATMKSSEVLPTTNLVQIVNLKEGFASSPSPAVSPSWKRGPKAEF